MKHWKWSGWWGVSLLCWSFWVAELSAAVDSFQAGTEASRAGNWSQASLAFENSLQYHPASGTLLNLGLVEWRHGHLGRAIWSWQEAAWLDPLNRDVNNDLLFARQSTSVDAPDLTWYETASTWLPADWWATICSLSLWLTLAMMLLPRVFRAQKTGWQPWLAALGFGLFLLTLPANVGVVTRANFGIVLEQNTLLRLTPTEDGETISSLGAGEPVRRVRTRGNYWFVRTPHGAGWVKQVQIGRLSQPSPKGLVSLDARSHGQILHHYV